MENASNVSTAEIENFLVRRLGEKEGTEIIEYVHTEIERKVVKRGKRGKDKTVRYQKVNHLYQM